MRLLPGLLLGTTLVLTACGGGSGGGGPAPAPSPTPSPTPVTVAITPQTAAVASGGMQQFACAVTGAANTGCTWKVQEAAGGGVVTAAGLYTAPTTAGVYHVVATSVADTTRSASAAVTVAPPQPAANPWVTGYYLGYFWDQMYPPEAVDMRAMTHFVFGRVAPGGGTLGGAAGTVRPGAGTGHQAGLSPDGTRSVEDYLVKRAHDGGAKALLMIGGMGDGDGFLKSTTDATRPAFVKNLADYLVAHDYDGIDVDWEDALDGSDALKVSATEARRRLKALLAELRTEANGRNRYGAGGRPVLITFPGYAVSINFRQPGGKVEQWRADVAALVDQYNLMSYGIGTAYTGGGLSSWFSGPLFDAGGTTPYDLESSIAAYELTGVPRSKLGIGIGFFGLYWGPPIFGPREPTDGRDDIWETDDVALRYAELVRMGYLNHGTYVWDEPAQVGYRTYGPGGYVPAGSGRNSAGFLTYEDERSIQAKGAWVRQTGVGGTIIWAINYDYLPNKTSPLLTQVKKSFLLRQ